jgi:hypothetical protein
MSRSYTPPPPKKKNNASVVCSETAYLKGHGHFLVLNTLNTPCYNKGAEQGGSLRHADVHVTVE